MSTSCAVTSCFNNLNKINCNVSFHRFPSKDITKRDKWIKFCRRKDKFNFNKSRICSDHFKKEDYEKDLKNKLLNLPQKRKLTESAVPSIFSNKILKISSLIQNDERELRVAKRSSKKLVSELLENSEQIIDSSKEDSVIESCMIVSKDVECQTDVERSSNLKHCCSHIKKIIKLKQDIIKLKKKIINQNKQICSLTTPLKKSYSQKKIASSLALRSVSLKGYETVRKIWQLNIPAPRTIRKRIEGFQCFPGLINEVIGALKIKTEQLDTNSKLCSISFDEMSLDSRYIIDKVQDRIYSTSKVQVVMVRGICINWKQPVYYNYDSSMKKETLLSIIYTLEKLGLRVVSTVSDFGFDNMSLWKSLEIDEKNTSFKNPYDSKRSIYVFADVPHMLKLIRNHVIDDGLLMSDGTEINANMLRHLVELNGSEMKLCPKFSSKILNVVRGERMRVRPAAQLLSNSVAKLFQQFYPTSNAFSFFKIVNNGFDVMNSRVPIDKLNPLKSGYGMALDEQNKALENLETLMSTIRFFTRGTQLKDEKKLKKALLPCQRGFIISINSFKKLRNELKNIYGVHYVLGSRLNQDCLESFFSEIRAIGTNNSPNAVEFRYRLRSLILGSKVRKSEKSSCEKVNLSFLATDILKNLTPKKLETKNYEFKRFSTVEPLSFKSLSIEVFDPNTESLRYLAGYIAWVLKRKNIGIFGVPSEKVPVPTDAIQASWIEFISAGGLLIPNDLIFSQVLASVKIFNEMIKGQFNRVKIHEYLEKEICKRFPDFNKEIVAQFVKTRMKIRVKELNNLKFSTINMKKSKILVKSFN